MKTGKTSKIAVFLLTILITYGFSAVIVPSKAQDEVVLVRMEPVSLTVNEGDLFNIAVHIDNMPADPGMVGVQFKITWDSAVLKGVSMTEVLFSSVTPPGEEGNIWALSNVTAEGYVDYGYTWMNSTRAIEKGYAPISGNHTVAIMALNATATGLTPLEFSFLKIGAMNATGWSVILVDYPKKPLPPNYSLIKSTVTVGNPPPTITIASPKNVTYAQTPINLTFTLSEPAQWIGYSRDGQANATITGNTSIPVSDGSHNLKVYANDTDGNMGVSAAVYFYVDATPPEASFTYSPAEPKAEIIFGNYKWNITFNASGSSDNWTQIVSYTWDFGDGSTGQGMAVIHLFRNAGTYDVILTVKDGANHTDTETVTVTLTEPAPPIIIPLWIIIFIAILAVWGAVIGVYWLRTKRKA